MNNRNRNRNEQQIEALQSVRPFKNNQTRPWPMDGGQKNGRTEPVPFDTSFVMITETLPERNTHRGNTEHRHY